MKNIEDIYPLAPLQEGMLFHTLHAASPAMYFQQFDYALRGDLDIPAFEHAWQQIVDRHPILRTAFAWKRNGRPLQAVFQRVKLPFEQHDWRRLTPARQSQQL